MKRKIIGFLVCLILIAPISSAMGTFQDTELASNQIVAETDIDADIVNMMNQVNESLLSHHLERLVEIGPRYTGSENCRKAAEYIYDEFEKIGLDAYYDEWRYPKLKCQNVVATLNGVDPSSDAVIILSAHYDTVKNTSGANDDGSGVAAMLTIANITSKYSFNHTIRFIAFSGEELGCFGSLAYAKKAYENGENIISVLEIDMIGYAKNTRNGEIIQIMEVERTKWITSFCQQISQKYSQYFGLSVQPVPNWCGCDHQPFLDYGYITA